MDENAKGILDLSEISRIQKEIEYNLYGDQPSGDQTARPTRSTGAIAPAAAPPAISPPLAPAFYHETIKNETRIHKKRKLRRLTAVTLIVCTLGTGSLGFGIGLGAPSASRFIFSGIDAEKNGNTLDSPDNNASMAVFNEQADPAPGAPAKQAIHSFADVVNLVEPSVVRIHTVAQNSSDYFSLPYDQEGAGSGIIFYENADAVFIVTNYHVIGGASSVAVNIGNSDLIPAAFVGSEPPSDLAVISVSKADIRKAGAEDVIPAAFGDSDVMQVGERVLAIGNAMGEGNTATLGIVSAIDKQIQVASRDLTVIQTDAAINPGNSGGPLVNIRGEVIGINTAKLSEGRVEGMGYSITSNIAKPILEEIMQQKTKPFLGIQGADVTEEVAELYHIPQLGVFVMSVISNSSAEKAGIQRGDIITSFNDISIFSMKQLQEEIAKCKMDDAVQVKAYREGKTPMLFKFRLGEYQSDSF
ncbi:MAG: trypsin-like peptidase domain-containing protein [Clostridiales bacterium]|jgi:serine protease Do|nr:trypsin-like peptidase domain-containing protein [Clostridiales bacterium]